MSPPPAPPTPPATVLDKDTKIPVYVLTGAVLLAIALTRFVDTQLAKFSDTANLAGSILTIEQKLQQQAYDTRDIKLELQRAFGAINTELQADDKARWSFAMMRDWASELKQQNPAINVPDPRKTKMEEDGN